MLLTWSFLHEGSGQLAGQYLSPTHALANDG